MAAQYAAIYPQSQKASYGANDIVSFVITSENLLLTTGSIRVNGTLFTSASGGTAVTPANKMYLDRFAGVQSLFSQITTTTAAEGVIESIQNYPRIVRMTREQSVDPVCLSSESRFVAEGCAISDDATVFNLASGAGTGAPGAGNFPFSVKPLIGLNQCTGNIPIRKTGTITIQLRLSQVLEAFFSLSSTEVTTGWTYALKDLQLSFQTLPDPGPKFDVPMVMRKCTSLAQGMSSDVTAVHDLLPINCVGVACSFGLNAHQLSGQFNEFCTEVPPGAVNRLEISINDQVFGGFLTYTLQSPSEILYNYAKSLNGRSLNTAGKLNSLALQARTDPAPETVLNTDTPVGENYGIGFWFGADTPVNFSKAAFGMNVYTSVGTLAAQTTMYLFFIELKPM